MALGEKLRKARLEAGLSQRQICGQTLTRSMLSQIEHGTASPSIKTLQYLASKLGKPVSYFLDEEPGTLPNQGALAAARQRYDAGDYAAALSALEECPGPDGIFDRERALLEKLSRLALAEQALKEGREPYAQALLSQAAGKTYCQAELERRRLLLLGRAGQPVSQALPSLDEELLLRAKEALDAGQPDRAEKLLDAAQDQAAPCWNLLRGQAHLAQGRYQQAAECFRAAEPRYPRQTAPNLEICYRELGDFRRAYEYACKQK